MLIDSCIAGYYVSTETSRLIKITLAKSGKNEIDNPLFQTYNDLNYGYTPSNKKNKNALSSMLSGTLEYYNEDYKILPFDNIPDDKTTACLIKEIKKLRDRKILCAIKDKDNPVHDDRIRSLQQHQQSVSKCSDPFQQIDPVQFAESGYFIQQKNIRCSGCSFALSIARFNALAIQEKDITKSLDSKKCLEITNTEHEQYTDAIKKVHITPKSHDDTFTAKPCLRESRGGNTLVSLVGPNDNMIDVQRYLELEVHEESGKPVIRTVPGCSIIATQPETQISDIPCFDYFCDLRYEKSNLYKELKKLEAKFQNDIDELKKSDNEDYTMQPEFQCLKAKKILLGVIEPSIRKLYIAIDKYNNSDQKTLSSPDVSANSGKPPKSRKKRLNDSSDDASPVTKKMKKTKSSTITANSALSTPSPSLFNNARTAQKTIRKLLLDLLADINVFNTCGSGIGVLLKKTLSSHYANSPASGFKDGHQINAGSVEIANAFWDAYTAKILNPVIEILSVDTQEGCQPEIPLFNEEQWTEILEKIFLHPKKSATKDMETQTE